MTISRPFSAALAAGLLAVLVVVVPPASALTLSPQGDITAAEGNPYDWFGSAVAASGDTVVVGAYQWPTQNMWGAAFVFARSGASWSQQATLTAPGDHYFEWFGYSVAVSGDTVLVGAPHRKVGDNHEQGQAFVFTRSGTDWTLQASLTASDGVAGGNFGWSVALEGDTAVVASPGGGVYVFSRSGGTWTQSAKLTPDGGDLSGSYGCSVALSGGTVAVGAFRRMAGTGFEQGAAYVFASSAGTWSQQAELTAADGAASDGFGWSVALSGDTLLVGAKQHAVGGATNQGAAYIYTRSGTTWSPHAMLSGGAQYGCFGYSVALSGDRALVGAPYVGGYGTPSVAPGAAYLYSRSGGTWRSDGATSPSGPGDHLGFAAALSGDTAVLGAPQDDVGSPSANWEQGSAYVFRVLPDPTACVLSTASRTTTYAQRVPVSGTLRSGATPLAGMPVQLQYLSGATWRNTGVPLVTSGTGTFTFYVAPTAKVAYRVRFGGASGLAASTSAVMAVTPRAWLTTPALPSAMSRIRRYTVAGYLKPRHTAGGRSVTLYCYRYQNGAYALRKTVTAANTDYSTYTRYAASVTLPYAGRWRVRAYHTDTGHAPTWSGYAYTTVR